MTVGSRSVDFFSGRPGDIEQNVPQSHTGCPIRRHDRAVRLSVGHFLPCFALSKGPTGKQIAETRALLLSQSSRNRKKIMLEPFAEKFSAQRTRLRSMPRWL
jgi:hypothetical protein